MALHYTGKSNKSDHTLGYTQYKKIIGPHYPPAEVADSTVAHMCHLAGHLNALMVSSINTDASAWPQFHFALSFLAVFVTPSAFKSPFVMGTNQTHDITSKNKVTDA